MNSLNFIKNCLLSLLLVFNLSFKKQTGTPDVEITLPTKIKTSEVQFKDTNKPPYKKYFNGRNFSKWVLPEGNIWWKIEDKVIKAKSGLNKKGSILWTEKEFKNYKVRLKFKFIGNLFIELIEKTLGCIEVFMDKWFISSLNLSYFFVNV